MKKHIVSLLLIALLLPLLGAAAPAAEPDAATILASSAARMEAAESYALDLSMKLGIASEGLSMNINLGYVEDTHRKPLQSHGRLSFSFMGQSLEMDYYILQDDATGPYETYMKSDATSPWEYEQMSEHPLSSITDIAMLTKLMSLQSESFTFAGREALGVGEAYLLTAELTEADLAENYSDEIDDLAGSMGMGFGDMSELLQSIPISIWFDASTFEPLRCEILLEDIPVPMDSGDSSVSMNCSLQIIIDVRDIDAAAAVVLPEEAMAARSTLSPLAQTLGTATAPAAEETPAIGIKALAEASTQAPATEAPEAPAATEAPTEAVTVAPVETDIPDEDVHASNLVLSSIEVAQSANNWEAASQFFINASVLNEEIQGLVTSNYAYIKDPYIMHATITTDLSSDGRMFQFGDAITNEIYQEIEGDILTRYSHSSSSGSDLTWIKRSLDMASLDSNNYLVEIGGLAETAHTFVLETEEELNGHLTFKLSGTIRSNVIRDLSTFINAMMQLEEGENKAVDATVQRFMDSALEDMPIILWLDTESLEPVRYLIDATSYADAVMDMIVETVADDVSFPLGEIASTVNKCVLTVDFTEINGRPSLQIPSEVRLMAMER